jgi:spore coat polysaccharide biosynthesis predicted glycosyltransferase SpsG
VTVVCDAGPVIGYGHLRRSLSLAQRLEDDGCNVSLHCRSPVIANYLTKKFDRSISADVMVYDLPFDINKEILSLRSEGVVSVALDWFGETAPDIAIVVHPHAPFSARKASFVGVDYHIIRDEITQQPRGISRSYILVVLGGGDLLGTGEVVAERASGFGEKTLLVQGPLAKYSSNSSSYTVVADPSNIEEMMAGCDWMITNGGGSMLEGMCLGKAVVSIPQTNLEMNLARHFFRLGGILGIGLDAVRPYSVSRLREVGDAASVLVDGMGLKRVSNIIKSISK